MSQKLTINNYSDINILEETELTADAASAQAVIAVTNTDGFATNSHYVIGRIGGESLEKLLCLSVAAPTGITATTNLVRSHKQSEKVTKIYGNKARIYRASNSDGSQPADADFSLLTTVDLDFDGSDTTYTDTAGSSDYWYKFTYYDSVATTETPLAQSTAVRGGGVGNYASLASIRKQAGLENNRYISDDKIEEKRQAAQRLIDAELNGVYVIPFVAPINPLISEITRLLAGGYLLTQEYTINSGGRLYAEGQSMIDRVTNKEKTGLLDRLNSKELKLTDVTGAPETTSGVSTYSGWPNATTETADPTVGGGARGFRVSDRY